MKIETHKMTQSILNNTSLFSFPIRVYYEDTDAGGVVYHANYLNFFERARTEWLRDLGYEQDQLRLIEKLLFAVRKVEIDYLKPAFFNDQLIVTVQITKVGASTLDVSQQMVAVNKKEEQLLSVAKVLLVCIDADKFRPKKIPKHINTAIKNSPYCTNTLKRS